MKSNPEAEIYTPPWLAVRLLELVLSPVIAENVIGDLQEEYHTRVNHRGLRTATWWFWTQSFGVLKTSLIEFGARPLQFFSNMPKGTLAFGVALGCFFSLSLTSLLFNQRDSITNVPLVQRGSSPRNTPSPEISHDERSYVLPRASESGNAPRNTFSTKRMPRHRLNAPSPVLSEKGRIPICVTASVVKDNQKLEEELVRALIASLEKTRRFKILTTAQERVVPRDACEINLKLGGAAGPVETIWATLSDTEGKMIWSSEKNYRGGQRGAMMNISSDMGVDIATLLTLANGRSYTALYAE